MRRTALIGRNDDVAAVRSLLTEEQLVSVIGLGGVGKTSVAREVMASWPAGSCMVDLSAVHDDARVDETLTQVLGISPGGDARAVIATWARATPACLMVIDNCEHVRDAAARLAELIVSSGSVKILATSRVPLASRSEVIYPLPPLSWVDAEALYRARADPRSGYRPDDAVVDRLCHLLGDIPLGIELAAARSSVLTPDDMIRDLSTVTFPAITGPPSARWRDTGADGLVDVVAWAATALSDDADMVFRRCAVFPGGFTMEAARTMVGAELDTARLVDAFSELARASLIEVGFGERARYRYLDLVRQGADRRIDDVDERELCRRRMIEWAVAATSALTYLDLPRVLEEVTNLTAAAEHACAAGRNRRRPADHRRLVRPVERPTSRTPGQQTGRRPAARRKSPPPIPPQLRRLAFALFIHWGSVARAKEFAAIVLDRDPDSRSGGWAIFTLGHIDGDLDKVRRAIELARRWDDPMLQMYATCMAVDNAGRSGAHDAWELVSEHNDSPQGSTSRGRTSWPRWCGDRPAARSIRQPRCSTSSAPPPWPSSTGSPGTRRSPGRSSDWPVQPAIPTADWPRRVGSARRSSCQHLIPHDPRPRPHREHARGTRARRHRSSLRRGRVRNASAPPREHVSYASIARPTPTIRPLSIRHHHGHPRAHRNPRRPNRELAESSVVGDSRCGPLVRMMPQRRAESDRGPRPRLTGVSAATPATRHGRPGATIRMSHRESTTRAAAVTSHRRFVRFQGADPDSRSRGKSPCSP